MLCYLKLLDVTLDHQPLPFFISDTYQIDILLKEIPKSPIIFFDVNVFVRIILNQISRNGKLYYITFIIKRTFKKNRINNTPILNFQYIL